MKMNKEELYERSYNKIWCKMMYTQQNLKKYKEMLNDFNGTESLSKSAIESSVDFNKRELKVLSHILKLIETTE